MRVLGAALVSTLLPLAAAAEPPAPGPPPCGRCGPAPSYPAYVCADGRHRGGRGPCVQRQDGSCGYLRLVCPEDRPRGGACGAAECGSPPAVSRWSCPGTAETGAFDGCMRDREGRCGWVHQPCSAPSRRGTVVQTPAPAPPPAPTPTRSCAGLPDIEQLRTWPVVSVCRPGGGPAPPPLRRVRSLGDGTFIFSGPAGCFRGRTIRCFSK